MLMAVEQQSHLAFIARWRSTLDSNNAKISDSVASFVLVFAASTQSSDLGKQSGDYFFGIVS